MVSLNTEGLKQFAGKFKRRPVDVVGLDVASSGIKAVRLRKSGEEVAIVAADILSSVRLPQVPEDAPFEVDALRLPSEFSAKFASFAMSGGKSTVKLLALPGGGNQDPADLEGKILETVGGEEQAAHLRINYKAIGGGRGRAEMRVLVVAVPEVLASAACMLLPTGLPAPYSVEVSGLAAMTAFLQGPGNPEGDNAVGLIEFGLNTSYFAIFHQGGPLLMRKFDFGSEAILAKVQESLGVDRTTSEGIVADGSFDVSQQISEVMDGFVKQVIVSRDFVERRENCHVAKVYASGGMVKSRDWLLEMRSALGFDVEVWNPFGLLQFTENPLPEPLQGQEARFSAAIGAALGTLNQDEE